MTPLLLSLIALSVLSVFWLENVMANNDFRNALSTLNELRQCAFQSEYRWFKLPKLASLAKTSNSVLNSILEEQHIKFWQFLRKFDYEQDMKRLLHHCKGAALGLGLSAKSNPLLGFHSSAKEAALLRPVFKMDLHNFCLILKKSKGEHALDRLKKAVQGDALGYDRLKTDMILSAIHFLDIALLVKKGSWYAFTTHHLDCLQSSDRALHCIRDWDFVDTVPQMLYLTFILHARQIIAYLSEDSVDCGDECQKVTNQQYDLERVILTEFPSQMMKEIRKESDANFAINFVEKSVRSRPVIHAVHLLSVKPPRSTCTLSANLYLDGDTLYITAIESIGTTHRDGWEGLYKEIINRITETRFIMSNPTILTV